jgi:hypothetical protein
MFRAAASLLLTAGLVAVATPVAAQKHEHEPGEDLVRAETAEPHATDGRRRPAAMDRSRLLVWTLPAAEALGVPLPG